MDFLQGIYKSSIYLHRPYNWLLTVSDSFYTVSQLWSGCTFSDLHK